MRRFLTIGLIPLLLASLTSLAAPSVTQAAQDAVETATSRYELLPDAGVVKVTVTISIKNTKPDTTVSQPCPAGTCIETKHYEITGTSMWVEHEAGPVTLSSNAGTVRQSVANDGQYYRILNLTFPTLYYGQTRTITATYQISGKPGSAGYIRAGKAYASFCAGGNGRDGGSVTAVFPTGYEVAVSSGDAMTSSTSGGKQVFTSGNLDSSLDFYSCLTATNTSALDKKTVDSGGQAFDVESWPEDTRWAARVQTDIQADFPALETLYGLPIAGSGAVIVQESAPAQLGDYAGTYTPTTRTAVISEDADDATVAHELSHIWFNGGLFAEKWMSEGFAGYSEKAAGPGKFEACTDPGSYPGTGSPDLGNWVMVTPKSSPSDEQVVKYEYASSCWIVTSLANKIGDQRVRDVLAAAATAEIPYLGSGAPEQIDPGRPIDAERLLDLIDERGMLPAGVTDLDLAQKLFAQFGALQDQAQLAARSTARASYHRLATATGAWKLPLAIRLPMSLWQFDTAGHAMATAGQIVALRDRVRSLVPSAHLDGGPLQVAFQSATDQQALDSLLATMQREVAAAAKVGDAQKAYDASRGPLEAFGLLGADVKQPLSNAIAALGQAKPDQAASSADQVLATLNGAGGAGLLRAGLAAGAVVLLVVIVSLLFWRRRRRVVATDAEKAAGPSATAESGFETESASLSAAGEQDWAESRASTGDSPDPAPAPEPDSGPPAG